MKYFGLVWKNAWRKKIRTSLTVLSVLVAFLMFSLLNAVSEAMTGGGATIESARRLVVIDKVSLINLLPIAYENRIEALPGVDKAAHATWFGGYYQDVKNQFGQFPVEPEKYLSLFPELEMPDAQYQAFVRNRTGAAVGRTLADKYGWQVGDRIPIHSSIWSKKDGTRNWEFDIEAILENTSSGGSDAMMLFHYDYFDEARAGGQGLVGWYTIMLNDGANPVEVANAVDAEFANSPNETKTSTEDAFARSFMEQLGDIALIVQLILGAVFFTLLLVTGNTMSQSVRERIGELAVLKTVGFSDRTMLGVVLSESILIMVIGGGLGLLFGWVAVTALSGAFTSMLGIGLSLSPGLVITGVAFMVAAGVIAGIFPALSAMRLPIVDALARA
jgi:putative ABC transport system permease protein